MDEAPRRIAGMGRRIFIRDAVQQSLKAMCKAVTSSLPEDLPPKCSILAMKYACKLKLSNHLHPSQYQEVGLSREELLTIAAEMEVYLRSCGLDMESFNQLNSFDNAIAESVHSDIPIPIPWNRGASRCREQLTNY
jgi:hypothetical protein